MHVSITAYGTFYCMYIHHHNMVGVVMMVPTGMYGMVPYHNTIPLPIPYILLP
jgi:hypothetical protein